LFDKILRKADFVIIPFVIKLDTSLTLIIFSTIKSGYELMLKYHLDKILLKFLINISYNIEIVVALMFVMPITVISLAGMLLSYKYKVAEDARSREIPPLRKKSIKN